MHNSTSAVEFPVSLLLLFSPPPPPPAGVSPSSVLSPSASLPFPVGNIVGVAIGLLSPDEPKRSECSPTSSITLLLPASSHYKERERLYYSFCLSLIVLTGSESDARRSFCWDNSLDAYCAIKSILAILC